MQRTNPGISGQPSNSHADLSADPLSANGRLDSWKAIASYLARDQRTARRWERELGLPVRRLPGGRGRSVYAYKSEIDAWLKVAETGAETPPAPALVPASVRRSRGWRLPVAAIGIVGALAWWMLARRVSPNEVRVKATADGVVATDLAGAVRWRYPFAPDYRWLLGSLDRVDPAIVAAGSRPAVFVAAAFRQRRSDSETESGTLFRFDLHGRLQQTFSFGDTVTIHGSTLAPPWAITSYAVRDSGGPRQIAVVAHHYVWNASLVTVLDDRLRRRTTYVHDGWIEAVRWLAPNRLLIAGYSNPHEGGMLALVDPAVAGVEARGTSTDCDLCPAAALVRMVILPRTELNRATQSPFNRAFISLDDSRVTARTAEMPLAGGGFVDALYEFTNDLDLVRAAYSNAYRERATALVAQGKLAHFSAVPSAILVWNRATGSQKVMAP